MSRVQRNNISNPWAAYFITPKQLCRYIPLKYIRFRRTKTQKAMSSPNTILLTWQLFPLAAYTAKIMTTNLVKICVHDNYEELIKSNAEISF
ncbi:hypothetical protein CVS40_2011 [Lucilia cuprina]|nr:hypothetical protein CVS40_2011 [Lucilia cuprina]